MHVHTAEPLVGVTTHLLLFSGPARDRQTDTVWQTEKLIADSYCLLFLVAWVVRDRTLTLCTTVGACPGCMQPDADG